jgi:iron complex outermembrane recepter protein
MPASFRPALRAVPCACLLALALPVAAQAPAAEALPEVTVSAERERETATSPVPGYTPRRAASATKTDAALSETPQSITIVTRDLITDTGATGLQDALNYAAGVRSDAYGLDSRTDSARIRGADAAEYLDGLRKHLSGYYTSNTRTDPYTLERIEVLRGPSAMLFGQGSVGGLVNMVSKRPLAEAQREVGVQFGSFNRKQLQADLTGPLSEDGQWLYRLVAVGRDSDTQVDYVRDDRKLVAPSLTWRPNASTSLTLQALWQEDRTGSTSQFFPWAGMVSDNPNGRIPTDTFIGEPGVDRYDSERRSFGWQFEHRFSEDWAVRQNLRYSENKVVYYSIYGDSFSSPGGWPADPVNQRVLGRIGWFQHNKLNQLAADQHVEGQFNTGAVRHRLLAGLDVSRATARTAQAYVPAGTAIPDIDVYDPVYTGFTVPDLTALPKNTLTQIGVYVQDQLRFAEHWVVVAGLRHDRVNNESTGSRGAKTSAMTHRLGLLYEAANGLSPYLSYSEAFTPVAGRNCSGDLLQPQRGKQWEAGIKYLPAERQIALGAAVYDLREKSRSVSGTGPDCVQQVGETKTRGVELEAKATVARVVDVVASYTYTDIDETLEAVPENQASVWTKYRFALGGTPGFSAGLGLRWLESFRNAPAPITPSVTLLDALLAWENPTWRAALNVTNLTDKTYVATCLGRGDCWYGARRTVNATVTYRF